ncbi:GCN5-like N-acetyltransferase [Alicyclobacillus hesperidum URH17-3-68]|nr:GCN5-like N-acetyltransferase [Alicyclobacillus hesperidum URH17-3-68]
MAAMLIRELVNMARDEGLKLQPVCSYAKVQFERHPEYVDVLLSS